MRRILIALVALGLGAFATHRLLFADDPKPASLSALSPEEQARVKQLIENLGSDDFQVREGATKELIGFGERARAALEDATKSTVPEVRFRADQILRRLGGKNQERKLDDGTPPAGATEPGAGPSGPGADGSWPWGRGFGDEDMRKWIEDAQRRMRELQDEMQKRFGGFMRPGGFVGRRHFHEGDADLTLTRRGATLAIAEKGADGVETTKTYEGKDLAAILDAHPDLKDKPDVAALVEDVKKAQEEAKEAPRPTMPFFGPGFRMQTDSQGVTVEVTPGHAKVTVTEKGPDGKPVTKTYEGADLETIKKEHPEIAGKVGGFELRIGPDDGTEPGEPFRGEPLRPFPGPFGHPTPGEAASPETGPFGLALAPVAPVLRAQLNLADGRGAVVGAVRPDSDAAKMGFQVHDVIVKVNGTEVSFSEAPNTVRDLIRAAKDGALSVEVLRGGKTMTLSK